LRRFDLRRHWPIFVGLFVVLLHVPYLRPGGPWTRLPEPLKLGQDEGTVLADSYRITRGEVMYRDFFEFQGPVFYYANAAVMSVTGPSVAAARALRILTTAAAAALLALLVARLSGSRAAGVGAAAIHAAVLVPMWPYAYPHWMAETWALAGIALMTGLKPRYFLAGAAFALSVATIQSVGVPVLVAGIGTAALPGIAARSGRRAWVSPLKVLGGAATVLGAIAVYFLVHGALDDLWYATAVWTRDHYSLGQDPETIYGWWVQNAVDAHLGIPIHWFLLSVLGLGAILVLPFFGLAGGLAAAALSVKGLREREPRQEVGIIGGCALATLTPVWLAPVRPDITHLAFLGSFGLLGVGVLLAYLGRTPAAARFGRVFLASVGGALLLVYGWKTLQTRAASAAKGTWREEVLRLEHGGRVKALPADATVVIGWMSGFYYLYLRPPAVAHTYIPPSRWRYLSEPQWQRIGDEIASRRPALIALTSEQWQSILKRRPDLAGLYVKQGVLLVPKKP
jgi:hypothetical protein